MKRAISVLLVASCLVALSTAVATAIPHDNRWAGIALHIVPVPPTPPQPCTVPGLTNSTMNYQEPSLTVPMVGPYYYTYVLVCNASDSTGIQGMEFGIMYQGGVNPEPGQPCPQTPICVDYFTLCGDLQFPATGWPGPGGSNMITWTDAHCQRTRSEPLVPHSVIAIGGYFYMSAYAPAQMFVIPRPVSGFAKVADCSAREDDITNYVPSHLGVAGWGGAPGYNPCGAPTPVENGTWGGIKSLYNR